jgi:hypothetical protein
MYINHYYLLKVWLMVSIMIAFISACAPALRLYSGEGGVEGFAYRLGFFCGVLAFEITYSLSIFISLYLIQYLLTTRFYMPALFVRSILILCFLIWVFLYCHINYGTWIHPFFAAYSGIAIYGFFTFDVYKYNVLYDDMKDDLELNYWNDDMERE